MMPNAALQLHPILDRVFQQTRVQILSVYLILNYVVQLRQPVLQYAKLAGYIQAYEA